MLTIKIPLKRNGLFQEEILCDLYGPGLGYEQCFEMDSMGYKETLDCTLKLNVVSKVNCIKLYHTICAIMSRGRSKIELGKKKKPSLVPSAGANILHWACEIVALRCVYIRNAWVKAIVYCYLVFKTLLSWKPEIVFNYTKRIIRAFSFAKQKKKKKKKATGCCYLKAISWVSLGDFTIKKPAKLGREICIILCSHTRKSHLQTSSSYFFCFFLTTTAD